MTHKILRREAFKPDVYLYDLAFSDTGLTGATKIYWLEQRMQHVYPGNYRIVKYVDADGHGEYRIKFDSPEDETWFRLKYA